MAPPVPLLGRVRGRLAAEGMSAVPGQTWLGTARPQPQHCSVSFCALPEVFLAEQCGFSKAFILACSLWEKCVFSGLSPYLSCCHFSLPSLLPVRGIRQPLPKARGRREGRAALTWGWDRQLPQVIWGWAVHSGSSDQPVSLLFCRYRGHAAASCHGLCLLPEG